MGDNWAIQIGRGGERLVEQTPSATVSGDPLCKPETMQMGLPGAGRGETVRGKNSGVQVPMLYFFTDYISVSLDIWELKVFCTFLLKADILPLFCNLCSWEGM